MNLKMKKSLGKLNFGVLPKLKKKTSKGINYGVMPSLKKDLGLKVR